MLFFVLMITTYKQIFSFLKRTRLEKLLFTTVAVLLIALVVVVGLAVHRILRADSGYSSQYNVCNTPTCIRCHIMLHLECIFWYFYNMYYEVGIVCIIYFFISALQTQL